MLTPTLPAPGGYATYPELGLYFPPVASPDTTCWMKVSTRLAPQYPR